MRIDSVKPTLKFPLTIISLLIVLSSSVRMSAWSAEGHETIADIAETLLKAAGQYDRVSTLLGTLSLSDISTCPDQVREKERDPSFQMSPACQQVFPNPPLGTEPWHFVDIPVTITNPTDQQIAQVCANNCVLTEIQHFGSILADSTQTPAVRLQALSFVVHFVGDVHQPLHAATRGNDGGGNAEQIKINSVTMALHHAWDDPLVGDINANPVTLATNLQPEITKASAEPKILPNDWARQSFSYAGAIAYNGIPVAKGTKVVATLGPKYIAAATPVVRIQLARAGVRLTDFIIANTPAAK